ncbi:uncharacterized protein isoform X8 [Salmo salar]|uniref:Uncharacterized protein LOC106608145 isoform X13 n=1 Tax=Salmo salar TaxID=8030 RepID=A0A1S3SAK8_SALSA|nr:uncharacterized protein LOC106608145 isoform X8 [Salmo salar]XP_045577004.1 uncharacterized protein LOC123743496 isoform X8 [Salmo salar]|eukprot:XP_014061377.1 PREDICTED: uncharacterized protein LOC106608145 isoform X13 [Salmo salar]
MSATEDDSELRGLLIQTLENNGVLNKLKAEMRAAVFLAMDEQARVENKTPLVNENLKKCLNTQDGCLVASLIIDFLQVFHIDFTLAVFQPEINSLNGLGSREQVSRDLGITETDMNRTTPLLLELVKRGRHREKASIFSAELSPRQIADARQKFDSYDKDRTDGICKEDLEALLGDVFPNFNKNMLERFVTDELRAGDKASTSDFQEFLGLYKRFFSQCRSVITHDTSDVIHNPSRYVEKMSPSPASKPPFRAYPVPNMLVRQQMWEEADSGVLIHRSPGLKDIRTVHRRRRLAPRVKVRVIWCRGTVRRPGATATPPWRARRSVLRWRRTQTRATRSLTTLCLNHRKPMADDDVDYDDDFNSHRSDISKSEVSIGEEIEEVSVKGPDNSNKFDEITQDLSVSQLSQTQGAD